MFKIFMKIVKKQQYQNLLVRYIHTRQTSKDLDYIIKHNPYYNYTIDNYTNLNNCSCTITINITYSKIDNIYNIVNDKGDFILCTESLTHNYLDLYITNIEPLKTNLYVSKN